MAVSVHEMTGHATLSTVTEPASRVSIRNCFPAMVMGTLPAVEMLAGVGGLNAIGAVQMGSNCRQQSPKSGQLFSHEHPVGVLQGFGAVFMRHVAGAAPAGVQVPHVCAVHDETCAVATTGTDSDTTSTSRSMGRHCGSNRSIRYAME